MRHDDPATGASMNLLKLYKKINRETENISFIFLF